MTRNSFLEVNKWSVRCSNHDPCIYYAMFSLQEWILYRFCECVKTSKA